MLLEIGNSHVKLCLGSFSYLLLQGIIKEQMFNEAKELYEIASMPTYRLKPSLCMIKY